MSIPVRRPIPEPPGPFLQDRPAPVHVEAELVEEDVRRHGERARQLQRPVGRVARVVQDAVAEVELAVVDDRARRRDHALLERRHCGDRLERRAGRIGGGDRAVEQRCAALLRRELPVPVLRDRLGELVGVEARVGAEREDLAVARVHGDERARLGAVDRGGPDGAAERVVGGALEVEVERQPQPLALARLAACHPPAVVAVAERVDHDARVAVLAAQVLVVALLDPVGPDPRARLDAAVARQLQLLRRDLARGAEQLGGELLVRVVAQVLLLDGDAGELLLALADVVEGVAVDGAADRHVRIGQLGDALDHALVDQLRADVDHVAEPAVQPPQLDLLHGNGRDRHRLGAARRTRQPAAVAPLGAGGAAALLADVALERAQPVGGRQP